MRRWLSIASRFGLSGVDSAAIAAIIYSTKNTAGSRDYVATNNLKAGLVNMSFELR